MHLDCTIVTEMAEHFFQLELGAGGGGELTSDLKWEGVKRLLVCLYFFGTIAPEPAPAPAPLSLSKLSYPLKDYVNMNKTKSSETLGAHFECHNSLGCCSRGR